MAPNLECRMYEVKYPKVEYFRVCEDKRAFPLGHLFLIQLDPILAIHFLIPLHSTKGEKWSKIIPTWNCPRSKRESVMNSKKLVLKAILLPNVSWTLMKKSR
ncbi:hypothetical protein SESBI_11177 [Sesbania bispinosa]|nr:hypothetical protein SESBI_11177 [Sesbania bispinosa]